MTLYRKYRPKQFSDIVGRDSITKILTEELKSGRIAHAYLFSGTRGTGKTSIARILAKSLNCSNRDKETSEPCNECDSCIAINEARSQDLIEIDAASNRRIDEIRELREQVKYVPANATYKVYIIDEVHMLTTEAFNALLKTLEEPPSHAIFVLATTELQKIPETIFSRCQHFSFGKLTFVQIIERLKYIISQEKISVDDTVIEEIARRAGGSSRDAESLLGQVLSIGKDKISVEDASLFLPKVGFSRVMSWIQFLAKNDAKSALESLTKLENEGINLEFFLQEALEISRQLMLYMVVQDDEALGLYFSKDEIIEVQNLCQSSSVGQMRQIVIQLLRSNQDMKLSPDLPILPIELAVVELCSEVRVQSSELRVEKKEEKIRIADSAHEETRETQNVASVRRDDSADKREEVSSPVSDPQILTNTIKEEVKKSDQVSQAEQKSHSLKEILDGWGEVMTKIKDKNGALNFVLGVAQPVAVNGDSLELGFKYRLQQEKVSEMKNREIVETVIHEVYGSRYRIEPTLCQDMESIKKSDNIEGSPKLNKEEDALVEAALEVFEGAVVEN